MSKFIQIRYKTFRILLSSKIDNTFFFSSLQEAASSQLSNNVLRAEAEGSRYFEAAILNFIKTIVVTYSSKINQFNYQNRKFLGLFNITQKIMKFCLIFVQTKEKVPLSKQVWSDEQRFSSSKQNILFNPPNVVNKTILFN